VWQGLKSPVAPVPQSGPLRVTASGAAPAVTVKGPANVTFNAADLSLLFTPRKADGTPTSPSTILVGCVLDAQQNAVLATIAVAAAVSAPSPSQHGGGISVGSGPTGAKTSARAGTGGGTCSPTNPAACCPPPPKGGLKLNPRFPPPPVPKDSKGKLTTINGPEPACSYVAGFSNVRKLNESALIGPGLADLVIGQTIILPKDPLAYYYSQQQSVAQLDYHGLHEFPPAKATLLAFGFVPVSATLQLTEIGTINAFSVGPVLPQWICKPLCHTVTTIYSRVLLRIYNVKVNGVPLNVGSHCETVTPFDIVVQGQDPTYLINTGGILTGTVTIPPFTGCSNGPESLDRLFTAQVSGAGNFVKLIQGGPCTTVTGFGCPPAKPIPKP
jgi:hypothetical protein